MLLSESKTVQDGKIITKTTYDVEPTFEQNAQLRERMAAMDARAELLRQTNDLYRRELEANGIPVPRLV